MEGLSGDLAINLDDRKVPQRLADKFCILIDIFYDLFDDVAVITRWRWM